MFKDDEETIKKLPKLLIFSKDSDLDEILKWKRVITATGNTPEEMLQDLEEQMEQARLEDEKLEEDSTKTK